MTGFDDRKKGFERKFAHDQELQFKASARRNKLLGLWAAELMGIEGDDAEEYAKAVIRSDLEEPGDQDVFRKIRRDFDEKNIDQSDHQIRRTMDELMGAIHGVMPDGTNVTGMEVFRRAYAAVGLGWLLAPTGWPGLRPLFDRFYRWFARNRLRLPGRRAGACDGDRCRAPS